MNLQDLLNKHGLTQALLTKRGRLPADLNWVRDARSALVSELHATGMAWLDIQALTGLSNGSIQRLTTAKGNPASKAKIKNQAADLGKTWKGKSRPERSEQLKKMWSNGDFDHQRGSVLSDERKAALKAGWTPTARQDRSKQSLLLWQSPTADRLRTFHADPAERERRSLAQANRMKATPAKYLKGKTSTVLTPKGTEPKVKVRSSYEAAAICTLESDPTVLQYEYEAVIKLAEGKRILPDFIVRRASGTTLVEVKADWVTRLPSDHKVSLRLKAAEDYALQQGWSFAVWTEKKELANAL